MKANDGDSALAPQLTMGPVLYHWPAAQKRDFYFRVADEAPVDTVYIGEVICSKRAPFFEPFYDEVAQRLTNAGKKVVFSSLAEIMIPRERKMTADLCGQDDFIAEANDAAALYHLRGKPHRIGPFVNVYNENSLAFLAGNGAVHITLPVELPAAAIGRMAQSAGERSIGLEVAVYGRMPLALSARCYHARAHGRVKDNCQFVCENDPDGMVLKTLAGKPFLAVNGIQTLSYACLNLMGEIDSLRTLGINAFRLSPHTQDMAEIARLFRGVLDRTLDAREAGAKLREAALDAPFANGFYHGLEGHQWVDPLPAAA